MASEIEAIKYRLQNVSSSQQRYKDMKADIMDQNSNSTITTQNEWYDGRGDALFLEETDVVGIEEPKEQLLEWIHSINDDRLEVVSVVGQGGLGKTTLVKKAYDDDSVKRYFNSHVWIVASDNKDVKHLLKSLIGKLVSEIMEPQPQNLELMNVDELREFIYVFLKGKNYIIVLDDVWSTLIWDVIKFAFPKRRTHGCIIITTRSYVISNEACHETNHVYELKPLSKEKSMELFYKKAFPRSQSPPDYLHQYIENILKRCEGLPLAIVVIGGVLAAKNDIAQDWKKFSESITHELDVHGSLKRLWKIISLSYNDLPYYLKNCLLYLSIFPEGGLLYKVEIIRLWTEEGFVMSKRGKTMEEVAADYVNELLERSLIQVALRYKNGQIMTIRIHDLVREYITSKSRKHNIVTVYNGEEMQWPHKTRRLTILNFTYFTMETNTFEYLRSLILWYLGNQVKCDTIKELVSKCRLLKVLDLRGAPLKTIPSEVFKLYHLKYLCLRHTMITHISRSIKYLQNLETLNLSQCNVTELPSEVLNLPKLRQLLVYKNDNVFTFHSTQGVKIPCEIGNCLKSLQKLFHIDAGHEINGIKIVKEIGKLTQLRILGIVKLKSEDGKDICSSISKLTNLCWLSIGSIEQDVKLDLHYSLSSTCLPLLRTLILEGCLEKMPPWMSSLNNLTTLYLRWSNLVEDPLESLQGLPNLAFLDIHDANIEKLSFKAGGFRKLRELWLEELKCKQVIVEMSSMPLLQEWIIRDCKLLAEAPQGIEHLTNLKRVEFQNMKDEFLERVANEKRNEGDNWRLANISNLLFFYLMDDNTWKRLQV